MKYLVTGANGFVGTALCAEFLRQGQAVSAVVRSSSQPSSGQLQGSMRMVEVDSIDSKTDWSTALVNVEVVIHLAARVHVMHDNSVDPLTEFRSVNTAGTAHLARSAAAAGVKRFVYVSSIKVNGEATPPPHKFSETDQPAPLDPYGISKYEAEQALQRIAQETGLEVVIVRSPLVYGAGVKGNFAQMLKVISKSVPLPFASIKNLRSFIYVENLVDALIVCATHPHASGQTYIVSDGEDISTPGLLRQLAAIMDVPCRLIPCPPNLLRCMGSLIGKSAQVERLLGSLQVDSGKIRRELNWQPPYTLQLGLQATVLNQPIFK
jgi:nucleoside-diphosphate-sugar epimerase